MSIFDNLLATAMMGESGGGGGGDFSTAQVTVTMAENEWSSSGSVSFASDEDAGNRYLGVFLYNDGTFDSYGPHVEPNGSTTITAVWVGDSTVVIPDQHIASVSGSAVITDYGAQVTISGDCTINLDTNWE